LKVEEGSKASFFFHTYDSSRVWLTLAFYNNDNDGSIYKFSQMLQKAHRHQIMLGRMTATLMTLSPRFHAPDVGGLEDAHTYVDNGRMGIDDSFCRIWISKKS